MPAPCDAMFGGESLSDCTWSFQQAAIPAFVPEIPPQLTPPPFAQFIPELAAGEASGLVLGGLAGVGLLGIGASLGIGAPAPDEYGISDLQALIDAGFYGDLVAKPGIAPDFALPPLDLPTVPSITPDLTPNQEIVITAPPLTRPQPQPFVDPFFAPIGVPSVTPYVAPYPPGLPRPARAPLPAGTPSPATSPAGAPSPVASPGAVPRALPEPAPAPQPVPLPRAQPAQRVDQPSAPPFLRPPQTGNPLLDVPLAPSVTYSQNAKVGVGPLVIPDLGEMPLPNPELAPARKDCPQAKDKKKQDQRKRQARTLCHAGTYQERANWRLSKHAQRVIPCR